MKKYYIIIAVFTSLLLISLYIFLRKDKKAKNDLFDTSYVHRIDILIDSADLSEMLDHPDTNMMKSARFVFHYKNKKDSLENIGIRIKGNNSRFNDKKSFKIGFNAFEKGKKYKGLQKLNLNAYWNDPTHLRAHLTTKAYEYMGVSVARSSFSELYINDVYYGLYNLGEHIDEQFLKRNFGSKKGNLYKCLSPANLVFHGNNAEEYKRIWDGTDIYDLKSNKEEHDLSGLIDFIDILNNTPLEDLEEKLESRFDVDAYLRILAIDVAVGNWDSYLYSANNFYLYDNPVNGKIEFIPYDFDNTFGMDWVNVDWAKRDIYHWTKKEPIVVMPDSTRSFTKEEREGIQQFINFWDGDTLRPLYTRLLEVEKYRDQYNANLITVLDYLNSEELAMEMDSLLSMLSPSMERDTMDNFTMEQIDSAMTMGLNVYLDVFLRDQYYLPYGIKEFISESSQNIRSQIE